MSPAAEDTLERAIRTSSLTITQLADAIATPQVSATRLAGSSARFYQQLDRRQELVHRLKAAFEEYRAAFVAFCTAVSGSIERLPTGTSNCKYTSSTASRGTAAELRLNLAEAASSQIESEVEAVDKTLETSLSELTALYRASKQADELAKLLTGEAATTAQLDRILARIRAGVGGESQKAIRTPALVLSRNTDDEGAIGGHNISFEPTRLRIAPPVAARGGAGRGRGRGPVPSVAERPSIRRADAAPAVEPGTALRTNRPGTLLEEIRSTHNANAEPSIAPRLAADAANCACALVVQTPQGEIYFARTTPPPVQRKLSDATSIVDALTGPPRSNVVRFDGFGRSPELVESVIRSTDVALYAAEAPSTRLQRFTEAATRLFTRAEPTAADSSAAVFAFLRKNGQRDILQIGGLSPEAAGPMLKREVAWRTAAVSPGEMRVLETGSTMTSTVVRFGAGRGATTIDRITIEVQTQPGVPGVAAQRLATVARTTLTGVSPADSSMAEGVVRLRDTIRRQLNPSEINFFVGSGATPTRIVQVRRSTAAHGE